MATRTDYKAEAVEAARSVLVELVQLLGEYRDDIVLVGGWVPELLLASGEVPHVGTMDVDLALNHLSLTEAGYRRIGDILLSRGYRQSSQQPFVFLCDVPAGDRTITVQVDLLAGEYGGTGKSHRTQKVQDVFRGEGHGPVRPSQGEGRFRRLLLHKKLPGRCGGTGSRIPPLR